MVGGPGAGKVEWLKNWTLKGKMVFIPSIANSGVCYSIVLTAPFAVLLLQCSCCSYYIFCFRCCIWLFLFCSIALNESDLLQLCSEYYVMHCVPRRAVTTEVQVFGSVGAYCDLQPMYVLAACDISRAVNLSAVNALTHASKLKELETDQ